MSVTTFVFFTFVCVAFSFAIVIIAAFEVRARRRLLRAESAGAAAAAAYRARYAEGVPTPDRIEILITDWGAQNGARRWRWLVWNASPASDDVEGLLVPYALGNAPTFEAATADAQSAAKRTFPSTPYRVVKM